MALAFSGTVTQAETRVALVIGNAAYEHTAALANPGNDAEDMATALRHVGFSVTFERNLDKRGMEQAIARFARAARDADAALFYYAGHGLQHRGLNYLMPVDAKLEDEYSLNFEMARVDDVLGSLGKARGVKILVLDACRRNPLAEKLSRLATTRDFSGSRGLARLDATRGMVVAYATQSDQVAVDGTGRNSPFTAALVKQLNEPGLEIGALFRRVAAQVQRATAGRQLPELSVSLVGEFYFSRVDSDVQAWAKLRGSQDPASLREFLARYPSSPLAYDIRERLEEIEPADRTRLEPGRMAAETAKLEGARIEQPARDQLAAQQAEQEKPEPRPPSGNVQTVMLTPTAEHASPPLPAPALSRATLVQEIKKELKRVGCYGGRLDEKWPSSEALASVRKFATHANLSPQPREPTIEFLEVIRERFGRVCPLECSARQVERDGRCIAKTCPPGFVIDGDGDCARQKNRPKAAALPAEQSQRTAVPAVKSTPNVRSEPTPRTPHSGKADRPLETTRAIDRLPPAGGLRKEPPAGSVPTGSSVLVDDGSCPRGMIKEITGGNLERNVPRGRRCVTR
jgi:hypothetical protein